MAGYHTHAAAPVYHLEDRFSRMYTGKRADHNARVAQQETEAARVRIVRRSNVNPMIAIRVDPNRVVEANRVLKLTGAEEAENYKMAHEDGWRSRRRGRVEISMVSDIGRTNAVPGARFKTI